MPWTQRFEEVRRLLGVSEPNSIRSSIVYGSRANLRIVSVGPSSESGGMIALTRLPSGRRASTIGDASSTRRPTRETILSMIRVRCSSSTNAASVASITPGALDVDPVEAVDHHLGDGVVGEERLDRAVAEDVGRDLRISRSRSTAGERRAVAVELARDDLRRPPAQAARGPWFENSHGPSFGRCTHAARASSARRTGRRTGCLAPSPRSGSVVGLLVLRPGCARSGGRCWRRLVAAELVLEVHEPSLRGGGAGVSQRRLGACPRRAAGAAPTGSSRAAISATAWANSDVALESAAAAPRFTAGATTGSFGISNADLHAERSPRRRPSSGRRSASRGSARGSSATSGIRAARASAGSA